MILKMKFLTFISFLMIPTSFALAETLTLTTYYPAPFGAYDQLRLVPRASDLTNPCAIGTIYVNSSHVMRYCRDDGFGDGTWDTMPGLWSKTNDFVYPTDTGSNPNLKVGIGKTDPGTELDVVGDINASSTYQLDGTAMLANEGDESIQIGGAGASSSGNTYNVFIGRNAGGSALNSSSNVLIGNWAGQNVRGQENVFIGQATGIDVTTGLRNTYLGRSAGRQNTTGSNNVALGYSSGYALTGDRNTYLGVSAGTQTNGSLNTFVGYRAGNATIGSNNVILGADSQDIAATNHGSGNVFIGFQAGRNESGSNKLYIANSSGTPLIYGDFSTGRTGIGTTSPLRHFTVEGSPGVLSLFTGTNASGLLVDFDSSQNADSAIRFQGGSNWTLGMDSSLGNALVIGNFNNFPGLTANTDKDITITTAGNVGVGTTAPTSKMHIIGDLTVSGSIFYGGGFAKSSSRALKENIAPLSLNSAVETLKGLQPMTFYYKSDEKKDLNVGFIAEDVPELVAIPDRKGLDSMDIVSVLTKGVQHQQEMLEQQQKEIEQLKERLK